MMSEWLRASGPMLGRALDHYRPHQKETDLKRLMRLARVATASLAAMITLAGPAHALTEAEARAFVDELLSFYAARPGSVGGLVIASEPTVSQDGAGYTFGLADVNYTMLDGIIWLGDISIRVQPADGDRFSLDVALPERVTITEAGVTVGEIFLGARQFSGIWDPSLFVFTEFDTTVESIEFRTDAEMPVSTGPLTLVRETVQVADARWDAVTTFQMEGITVGPRSAPPLAQIEGITARTQLSGVDLASYGAMVQALQFDPMSMWPQAGMSAESLNAVADFYEHVAVGRIDSSFAIAGMRVRGTEFGNEADVSIGQVLFESAWSNASDGLGTLTSRIALGEVAVDGLDLESMDPLVPRAFEIDIEIARLPMAAMLRSVSGMFEQLAEVPEDGLPMAQLAILGELQQLLSESGVVLRLRQVRLAAPTALAELQGEGRMDVATAYGAVGELTLEVDGVDRVIAILRADPADTDAAGAAAMLMLLQGLGDPVTGEPGATRLRYHFSVGADGIVLLNGDDLSPLLGLFQ